MSRDTVTLALYISGDGHRARSAVANLRALCDGPLRGRCEFSVVDVLESPENAEYARILATPTLVKIAPVPERRVIGDLSDAALVLAALDIDAATKR